MSRRRIKYLVGFTLIEMSVVAMLLLIVVATLVSVTTVAMARNRESKERTVATRLAQEGIEWIRSERDRVGYEAIANMVPASPNPPKDYCLTQLPALTDNGFESLSAAACGTADWVASYPNLFIRQMTLTNTGSDVLVTMRVTWKKSGSQDNVVELSGSLSQWSK